MDSVARLVNQIMDEFSKDPHVLMQFEAIDLFHLK
jgi:hypothetical protein